MGMRAFAGSGCCSALLSKGASPLPGTRCGGELRRGRPENKHGVKAAKCEGIRHRVIHLALAAGIRRVIEVAFRIRIVETDGRGNEIMLDGLHRGDGLDAAAGAQAMTV